MLWFFFALATSILHAVANHIDKHLISTYFKEGGVGALVLFTSLFALIALPVVAVFAPNVLAVSASEAGWLTLSGGCALLYVMLYLYALVGEDASVVVPFFQLSSVFSYVLGFFVLGETLSMQHVGAVILIVMGAVVLSFARRGGIVVFRAKVVSLMVVASAFYALQGVIFKLIAVQAGFVDSLFWGLVGQIIVGFLLFCFLTSYRTQFVQTLKGNRAHILGLNFLNGLLIILGDIALAYASLLAPVTIVYAVGGLQPLFVFLFGLGLTRVAPSFAREPHAKQDVVQKSIGIVLVVVGGLLLF